MSDGFEMVSAELTLSLEGGVSGMIVNNLTTDVEGYALDARQGKVLDEKKLDNTKVANNLTTVEEGWALDARQGRLLDENKLNMANVFNDLTQENKGYALDARQGRLLNEKKLDKASIVDDLTTGGAECALSAQQGKTLRELMTTSLVQTAVLKANGWAGADPSTQTVAVAGVTADQNRIHIIPNPIPSQYAMYSECQIRATSQGNGTLTFAASDIPEANITVNILIVDSGVSA